MKKHVFLILFNVVFLIGLLFIQVNWIMRVADKEEAIFSQKVRMALSQTINELKSDTVMCNQMACGFNEAGGCINGMFNLGKKEKHQFNHLIEDNLKELDIDLNYDFDIVSDSSNVYEVLGNNAYAQSLEDALDREGIHIKIHFPDKSVFIISQIGFMFIISVILIIVITASFIITIINYQKEKRLAINTKNFINNMVHEFKTPLANVSLANNMIKKNSDNEKVGRYTSIIKDENAKLEKQVEKILLVSSIEKNINNLNNIDTHTVINNSVTSFELLLNDIGGKINMSLKANDHIVNAEEEHLFNAISNIIDNAIKYSVNKPEITIETYNKDNFLHIKIQDNGIGIAKEHIPLIFDKYYRVATGDIHDVKGFGIGLAYVKGVIDAFNGKIIVESEPGKGSIFNIFLPIFKS